MSRATNQQIAQGFVQGLQNFTQGYIKRKDREHAETILNDPNSSPVQKALAWESISQGSGTKAYDTILKEQELKKQEKMENQVNRELFPESYTQEDVGTRAGVGAIDSPVSVANQNAQTAFPGYKSFGQQAPDSGEPTIEQGGIVPEEMSQEQQPPAQSGLQSVPTEKLQNALVMTKDPGKIKAIKSELDRRNTETKAAALRDAAEITAEQRKQEKRVDQALRINDPYNKRMAGLKASTPVRSRAVDLARDAVRSGEVGKLSLNHLADVFNLPSLKTAQGAKLDQAIKTNLIGTLSEVTAKATNIFLEKVALDAFARAGQSKESNLMKLEALDTELKLSTLETEIYDQILKQDIEKFGFEQPYIELRVSEAVKPLQNDIMRGSAWRMKQYEESEKSYEKLAKNALKQVSKGTPLSKQMGRILLDKAGGNKDKAIALAERLGYTIYSPEEIRRYERQ